MKTYIVITKEVYKVFYEVKAKDKEDLKVLLTDNHPIDCGNEKGKEYYITLPESEDSYKVKDVESGDYFDLEL